MARARWIFIALFALSALLGGCVPDIPEGRFACDSDEDCPPDLVCRLSVARCYETLADAPDGGG